MKVRRPKKVVAFGELLLRLDTKNHERFVQAEAFDARYTGGEANVAASLAQWGVQTFALSKVPTHEIGQSCVNYLRRFNINTDWVLRGPGRLGILYVETGASQRPAKIIYDREHTCIRKIRRDELDWNTILRGKDWLHFTGTAPALGPNVLAVLKDGLRMARRKGVTVSFDCNYRSTLWSREDAARVLKGLMEYVDVFIGTHHDARALFGIDAEPSKSATQLRRRFRFKCVAYTLREGANASVNRFSGLLCDARGCEVSRAYDMQMVDRIGGGDAFSGGMIYGLLEGWPRQKTVEFATAAGCLKHSIPGDFNLVSLDEVRQLVATGESGKVRR
jgi:2-dehydro-3-deoxygluconokinase